MKDFGVSVLDVTNLNGAFKASLGGIWVKEVKWLDEGRSVFAVEVSAKDITVDAVFMRFVYDRE